MYNIATLPTFITISPPPSREEALINPASFSTKYMEFNQNEITFANVNMPQAVVWMSHVHSNIKDFHDSTETLNAETKNFRDSAEDAKNRAISAKDEIENYVIPDGTAYSLEHLQELVEYIILADATHTYIIEE